MPVWRVGRQHGGLQSLVAQPHGQHVGPAPPIVVGGWVAAARGGDTELARCRPGRRVGLRHQRQRVPLQQAHRRKTAPSAQQRGERLPGLRERRDRVGKAPCMGRQQGLHQGQEIGCRGIVGNRLLHAGRVAPVQTLLGHAQAQRGGIAGRRRMQVRFDPITQGCLPRQHAVLVQRRKQAPPQRRVHPCGQLQVQQLRHRRAQRANDEDAAQRTAAELVEARPVDAADQHQPQQRGRLVVIARREVVGQALDRAVGTVGHPQPHAPPSHGLGLLQQFGQTRLGSRRRHRPAFVLQRLRAAVDNQSAQCSADVSAVEAATAFTPPLQCAQQRRQRCLAAAPAGQHHGVEHALQVGRAWRDGRLFLFTWLVGCRVGARLGST